MEKRGFRASELIHGADYNPDQWTDMPEIIEEDFRLMELAGMNSATIGVFSWKRIEPEEGVYDFAWLDQIMDRMAENGKKVILAAPSGARPAWMDQKYSEVLRVSPERVRNLHGERHNHCYTSPYYRKKTVEMNTLLAKRYGEHPALYMWHVGNEYGGECHCELCQEAFREWLRKKYHNNIEELNKQWWTGFWSHGFSDFSEIESPSLRGENSLHGLKLDWRRFVTAQTVSFFENESRPFRELCPRIPVTTNLMGMYQAYDPWRIAPHMDMISWDSYPEWGREQDSEAAVACETAFSHDIFRTLKGQPFYLMESTPSVVNWREINKLKKPGMHVLASVQAIAHGADSVQYFQWRKSRGASEKFHGAVVDHYGKEDTRVFREVSGLGSVMKKLHEIAGSDVRAEAAVIYDWENSWAIGDIQGWRSPKLYDETVRQHYEAFRRLGIMVDVINEECSLDKYKIVAAPMLYLLRDSAAARLRTFVAEGGTLVLTFGSGQVNENDLCYLGGMPGDGLMEVAGVRAEELDTLYEKERNGLRMRSEEKRCYEADSYCELIRVLPGCEVLAEYTSDFYAGSPVLTRNSYGTGKCYYLAARAEQEFLVELYQNIAAEQNISHGFLETWEKTKEPGKLPEGVEIARRVGTQGTYYFVLNFSGEQQEVRLPEESRFVDMISGIETTGKIMLDKSGYRILKCQYTSVKVPNRSEK